jgi:3-hydroxyisobutyrate dehydrogenase
MKSGFIGLGAMGQGMAVNLNKAGHLQCAWNRSRERVEDFAAQHGIRLVDTLAEVAKECDLIITCVSADADLLQVVEALLPHLRRGSVLLDCSTVNADTARAISIKVRMAKSHFLDGPVSGGVEGANNGSLAMMVGGDGKVLERMRPVLQAIASSIVHMGPSGAGQATKAVNQIMGAGINQAVTEALAFAAGQDLDLNKVIEVVNQGASANWLLAHRGPNMVSGNFTAGFKVTLHDKDLRICQQMTRAAGVRLSVIEQTLGDYQRLIDQGHGDEDISALYRIKRAKFGHHG